MPANKTSAKGCVRRRRTRRVLGAGGGSSCGTMVAAPASRMVSPSAKGTRTVRGVLAEMLTSVLVAPILMAEQTKAVFSVLLGQDTGWMPQQRDSDGYRLRDCLRHHGRAMLLGVALTLAAFAISPVYAAWLSPAAFGMLLAAPLSWMSGLARWGAFTRRKGLMLTPEETHPPASLLAALPAAVKHAPTRQKPHRGSALEPSEFDEPSRAPRAAHAGLGFKRLHMVLHNLVPAACSARAVRVHARALRTS